MDLFHRFISFGTRGGVGVLGAGHENLCDDRRAAAFAAHQAPRRTSHLDNGPLPGVLWRKGGDFYDPERWQLQGLGPASKRDRKQQWDRSRACNDHSADSASVRAVSCQEVVAAGAGWRGRSFCRCGSRILVPGCAAGYHRHGLPALDPRHQQVGDLRRRPAVRAGRGAVHARTMVRTDAYHGGLPGGWLGDVEAQYVGDGMEYRQGPVPHRRRV